MPTGRGRHRSMARWLWPLVAALCLRGARAVYTMSVVTPVSGAIAGEVFSQQPEISVLEDELATIKGNLSDLKSKLYGRFGKNINLEE